MDPLCLAENLELKEKEIIAVYGAGGKSTMLYRLAQDLASSNKKVLLTTTTKILKPSEIPCVINSELEEALPALEEMFCKHDIVALGSSILPGNKLQGIEISWVKKLFKRGVAPYLLIEADGAAGKPIKGYAHYEPVLPPDSTLILPVLGIDAIGSGFDSKKVHRPELLWKIIGALSHEPLGVEHFIRCLKYMVNLGHHLAPSARIIPVVNKVDLIQEITPLRIIAEAFIGHPEVSRLLFTATAEKTVIRMVFALSDHFPPPYVSCVMLAAGASRRMGKDKLSLKINEETILQRSLKNALGSRVNEIILITRPGSDLSWLTFNDPRFRVVLNKDYKKGISSSLKTGIAAANVLAQGIIFTLADQPFIPAEVYDKIIESYSRKLNLLTFPIFKGRRGNPVLFDRRTWPLLMALEGDEGGKQIIPSIPKKEIITVETMSPGILIDIDTPEDFQKYWEVYQQ